MSMRTVPVNQSAGPLTGDCEPLRLMSIAIGCLIYREERWALVGGEACLPVGCGGSLMALWSFSQ